MDLLAPSDPPALLVQLDLLAQLDLQDLLALSALLARLA